MSLALSISVLFTSLLQLVNGTQSSACQAAASFPAPVIVILPLTRSLLT